ncbi:MAG: urea ABC transporter ATP-binding protein UrtD [Planctomycetota bacterium]|nr:urea ABC transporter ATP-binding protein UrtD [Planctomycetota bacterium]MCX8040008.1 urea ABC transporter ATP-binding protein UrtD [Planctomycetota bacterium]MDW8372902.1 urea ABC transporter ATP-binding protein UrtD [Planctomycetota bacterium]
MSDRSDIVQVTDVVVEFDGFRALDVPYFGIDRGELRVLIGPNGAGKTTLCDVISGKTRPKSGRIVIDDREVTDWPETAIARLGVGRKFQTPSVFDGLSVYENMELALPAQRGLRGALAGRASWRDERRILALLERVHLRALARTPARMLSHGQRQWLEIAMLMVSGARILLVDEPAAGLTDDETRLTAELLRDLAGAHTVLVIEHDMEFVRRLQSRVTVLNAGKILAEGSLEAVQADPRVREAYLGRGKHG